MCNDCKLNLYLFDYVYIRTEFIYSHLYRYLNKGCSLFPNESPVSIQPLNILHLSECLVGFKCMTTTWCCSLPGQNLQVRAYNLPYFLLHWLKGTKNKNPHNTYVLWGIPSALLPGNVMLYRNRHTAVFMGVLNSFYDKQNDIFTDVF